MIKILFAAILAFASTQALAAPWTSQIEAPPTMDAGYLLVQNKCPGDAGFPTAAQMAGKDVKIEWPKDRKCTFSNTSFTIAGQSSNPVKDVWSVGGHFERTGFNFQNYSGTIFIEGAVIDQKGQCQDAINAYYGRGDGGRFVVQNTHMTGVSYCSPGTHGDTVHLQGTGVMAKELKLENVWAHQVRQGVFVPPRPGGAYPGHGVKKLVINNTFLQADPNFAQDGNSLATSIFWKDSGEPLPPDGVWFGSKVYLKWWGGKPAGTSAWRNNITIPNASGEGAGRCATYNATTSGVRAGTWCAGDPPDGPPAPLNMIGLNYSRSKFTGSAPPDEPDEPDPPAYNVDNRVFIKAHTKLLAELANKHLTGSTSNDVVAYAYREHPKSAPAGSLDLCKSSGTNWGGDVADDVIYVTSELSAPADLDVTVGSAPAVRLALPANQASSGLQSEVPIADKVGAVRFSLKRSGTVVKEWSGKLAVTNAPAIRTVSTYMDSEIVTSAVPKVWFESVGMDRPEGNSGSTQFIVRAKRNVTNDTVSFTCSVKAGTATASDFVGGTLPSAQGSIQPTQSQSDFIINVNGDTTQESDETFFVECGSILPATYSALETTRLEGTIRNDDAGVGAPRFGVRALDQSVREGTGNALTKQRFEIYRFGDVSARSDTIDFCPGPAASNANSASASDFSGGWSPRKVTFAPAETVKVEEQSIIQDSTPEANETYDAMLRYAPAGTIVEVGTASATIVNDDGGGAGNTSYINAGHVSDDLYTDSNGITWSKDTGTGGSVDSNSHTYAGTSDQSLYRTFRYGASTYKFTVEPGSYRVVGHFSEPEDVNGSTNCETGNGKRVIAASLSAQNGNSVSKNDIDPYCDAGMRTAYATDIGTVYAPTGAITLDFRTAAGSQYVPIVNAIAVERVEEQIAARPMDWLNLGAEPGFSYTDSLGNNWRVPELSLVTGCEAYVDADKPQIDNTSDDPIYWSMCRGKDISINVPVDQNSGTVQKTVTLLMREPSAGPGSRLVDVYVNGTKQISSLDVAQETGGNNRALTKSISPVSVNDSGRINVRIVSTTSADAVISGVSITDQLSDAQATYKMGWRGKLKISKSALIKLVSPTGLAQSGNPIVLRKLNTTGGKLYACHGECDGTATIGLQPDTQASKNKLYIEVMAHEPADVNTSVFADENLRVGKSTQGTFTVAAAELLPDGTTGPESVITVNIIATRAK